MGDGSRGVHHRALLPDLPAETSLPPPNDQQDEDELFVWRIEAEVRVAAHETQETSCGACVPSVASHVCVVSVVCVVGLVSVVSLVLVSVVRLVCVVTCLSCQCCLPCFCLILCQYCF